MLWSATSCPTSLTVTSPTSLRVEGVPQDRDAEFRRAADEIMSANYDRNPGAGGTYDFSMRPNIANQMRAWPSWKPTCARRRSIPTSSAR